MLANGLWYRMYCNVTENQKLQSLPPEIFKAWVNFCCIAKRHSDFLPDDAQIAWELRISIEEAARHRALLKQRRLIDVVADDREKMHDWETWQKRSDISTERVRKLRAKQDRNGQRNGRETPKETEPVTSPKRPRKRKGNVLELELEQEQEQEREVYTPPVHDETQCETQPKTETPPLDDFIDRLRKRHPKHRTDSETVCFAALSPHILNAVNPSAILATIDRNHEGWCNSEQWHDRNGKFVPRLSKWLGSDDCLMEPPEANGFVNPRNSEDWINEL